MRSTTEPSRKPILTCRGCQAHGCSCFHPPFAFGGHKPGCEAGKKRPR